MQKSGFNLIGTIKPGRKFGIKNGKRVRRMMTALIKFLKEEEGTAVAEWALILVLIILGTLIAIQVFGDSPNISNRNR